MLPSELKQALDNKKQLYLIASLSGTGNQVNLIAIARLKSKPWWKRLAQEQQPLSLILFDVDKFKLYNDYYGHLEGDHCLIRIAQTVQQMVRRPADLVARYGGEEFSVLLPNTELVEAIKVAQRIQQAIHDQAISHTLSNVKDIVTVSLGITSLIPTCDIKPDTLIVSADKALYNAKQKGRDRYCTH